MHSSPGTGNQVHALRVLTINTGKGDAPYTERLHWMADELRCLDADVIACQEVFASAAATADTAGFLAQSLGMHVAAAPARQKLREVAGREEVMSSSGMALLSRYPFHRVDVLQLPSDARDGERIAQVGVLTVAGCCVAVANVHLTHLRECDSLRRSQLQAVLDALGSTGPAALRLVAGDFNTTASGEVLAPLLREGYRHFAVRDTGATAGDGESASTLIGLGAPRRRVDMILTLTGGGCETPGFAPAEIVLNRPHPGSGVFPSDHAGIMTTFELSPLADRP
jgi:endonuclease/exonuclease/phosphatase family metal-dependent hydrolase